MFPSGSRERALEQDTAKDQHKRAIDRVNEKAKKAGHEELNLFQPYILRHTALTRLAEAGCDVFTLARIAGHSSITITQRYIHPQADAIERAFRDHSEQSASSGGSSAKNRGGHKIGHTEKVRIDVGRKMLVRKGGLEPPRFYPPDPKSGASANSATLATLLIIQTGWKCVRSSGKSKGSPELEPPKLGWGLPKAVNA